MSTRLRELATSAGCCVLATGCQPSSAIVTPEAEPTGKSAQCPEPAVPKPAPGSSDDREAPRIVAAKFESSDRVRLSFSEPVEAPKQINPRQFRLSQAYSMVDYAGTYSNAYYYDLATHYGDELPLVFATVEQPEPDQLMLVLNRPIPLPICENLRMTQADEAAAAAQPDAAASKVHHGLFLHYTSRGSVGVRDPAGNQLGDFGGEWALHFGTREKRLSGAQPLVRFDLLIELECPTGTEFRGPPGPA